MFKKCIFATYFKILVVSKNLVIIPTYNEKENVDKMIRKVFSLETPFHLLIVEDNSPDGTANIVKTLQKEFPGQLHILERKGKLGLGTAYIAGFEYALENGYDYIFEMDCDFSHNPEDLERLYKAVIDGADVAIGSRYISGINVINWPLGRVLMSYFASMYVRIVTGMKIMDTTAGFKCYRRKVLETIEFEKMKREKAIQYFTKGEISRQTYDHLFQEYESKIANLTKKIRLLERKMKNKKSLFNLLKMRYKK